MSIQPAPERCIVRNTASSGRTQAVEPGRTAARYLHYGRMILSEDDAPVKVDTKNRETGLICLKGSAQGGEPGGSEPLVRCRQRAAGVCRGRLWAR
jgi:hypothetical protein